MAIRFACPSCRNSLVALDKDAGTEMICPQCRAEVAIPSITSSRPESWREEAARDPADDDRGSARGWSRWDDRDDRYEDDYAPRRDPRPWNTTLAGMALVFWAVAILTFLTMVTALLNLALADDPMALIGGPGNVSGLGALVMIAGCVILCLAIMGFVGMCMCCTVPRESGAKGRAIATVILIGAFVVIALIAIVFLVLLAGNEMVRGGGIGGPLPVTGVGLIMVILGAAIGYILIVTMWLLFHKAIADYYRNDALAKQTIWFIVLFALELIAGYVMQLMVNPDLLRGDFFGAMINKTMLYIATIWTMAWTLALGIWYLFIAAATRRTIIEGERRNDY